MSDDTKDTPPAVAGTIHPPLTIETGGMGKPKRLSKKDIMAADDTRRKDIYVPEWGGMVTLRSLTSILNDDLELSNKRDDNGDYIDRNIRAKYVARCLVDENDERILSDEDAAEWFKSKSGSVMEMLYAEAKLLNVASQEARDALVKNSNTGQGAST